MSKLNQTIFRKLQACAEEAREQGLVKLAQNIESAIGDSPGEPEPYSYSQVEDDVHREIWKAAMHLARYWGVNSIDVMKLDNSILIWASEMIDEVERSLGVNKGAIGPLEPKLPGQKD